AARKTPEKVKTTNMKRSLKRARKPKARTSSHGMTTIIESSHSAPELPGTDLFMEAGLLRIGALARFPELLHGISTRQAPDGEDWNLSARRGSPQHPPDPAVALRNREKLAALLGISLDRMVG